MKVTNLMEQIVEEVLDEQWHYLNVSCPCELCKNDILAVTLNALPPRYVAHDRGRVIVQARMMQEQMKADVLREIARAAGIVSTKPSHQ
ncbi:competence protein ComFB [Tumebacillus sp. BK434]|uniref:late competence development ComFB family protein n=1 Tax=Tumebacillus sp. BK434 TaxID=2512169 RepID=UPI0010DA0833|nr:late competence development ComFB family protein [Tumebacillus sp. BK434]TCP52421.1 competence protein ComFB [Tumebacillus sp. BK434]